MVKCKNHNMEIVEYNDYGYMSQCKECKETDTYDSTDMSGVNNFIAISMGIGAVIAIIMEIFGVL